MKALENLMDNYIKKKNQILLVFKCNIRGTENEWVSEISVCIIKADKLYFALTKYFQFKLIFVKNEVRLYMVIIRSTFTYDCKALTIIHQIYMKLKTFKNKI